VREQKERYSSQDLWYVNDCFLTGKKEKESPFTEIYEYLWKQKHFNSETKETTLVLTGEDTKLLPQQVTHMTLGIPNPTPSQTCTCSRQ
jgi:hypothetical protein